MATSTYDVNVQLTLATTAEQEGDVVSALDFLAEAHRLARGTDRPTRARVLLQNIRLRLRLTPLRPAFAF
ncbi:MAG: hypothetical protein ABI867_16275 [Kofleriaceae bacterium]